jgi:hypothetical protein
VATAVERKARVDVVRPADVVARVVVGRLEVEEVDDAGHTGVVAGMAVHGADAAGPGYIAGTRWLASWR